MAKKNVSKKKVGGYQDFVDRQASRAPKRIDTRPDLRHYRLRVRTPRDATKPVIAINADGKPLVESGKLSRIKPYQFEEAAPKPMTMAGVEATIRGAEKVNDHRTDALGYACGMRTATQAAIEDTVQIENPVHRAVFEVAAILEPLRPDDREHVVRVVRLLLHMDL